MVHLRARNNAAFALLAAQAVGRRLFARPASSLILILGIAFSSAALLAVIVASRASISAFSDAVSGLDSFELRSWGGEYSPQEVAAWLKESADKYTFSPFLDAQAEFAGRKVTLVGADMAVLDSKDLANTLFITKAFRATLKDARALQPPIRLTVDGKAATFARVVEVGAPAALAESQSLFVDIETIQQLLNRSGMVRWLAASPRAGAAAPTENGLPAGFYLSSAGERRAQAGKLLEAFRLNILVMVAMTLVVAVISVLNTLQLHVLGSTVELSTLRILGVGRRGIFSVVTLEALMLGVIGGVLGSTGGRPLARIISGMFLDTAGSLYFGGRELNTASILDSPHLGLAGFCTAVMISLLGAVLPAWQASRVAPALGARRPASSAPLPLSFLWIWFFACASMAVIMALAAQRYNSAMVAHGASVAVVAATLVAAALILSGVVSSIRWMLRNTRMAALLVGASLVASHRRAAALAAMVASAGCALLLGLGIMIGSFRQTLEGWIDHTVVADLFIRVADDTRGLESQALPEDLVQSFRSLKGVAQVTSFARVTTTLAGLSVQFGGTDLAWLLERGVYQLISGECRTSELEHGESVLVSEVASRKLEVVPGQRIELMGRSVRVCGVYRDFAAQGGAVLMESAPFKEIVGAYPIFSVGLYLMPGVSRGGVREGVERLATDRAVVLDNQGLREQILATFDRTFSITGLVRLLLFLMSLGGAAIGISQILFERAQELGTFRMLGADERELSLSVTWLGCEISLSAAMAGIVGGVALSFILLRVINPVSFGWSLEFAPHLGDFLLPVGALLVGVPIVALGAAMGLRVRMLNNRV